MGDKGDSDPLNKPRTPFGNHPASKDSGVSGRRLSNPLAIDKDLRSRLSAHPTPSSQFGKPSLVSQPNLSSRLYPDSKADPLRRVNKPIDCVPSAGAPKSHRELLASTNGGEERTSSGDIVTAMASRLATAERMLREKSELCREQQRTIEELNAKVAHLTAQLALKGDLPSDLTSSPKKKGSRSAEAPSPTGASRKLSSLDNAPVPSPSKARKRQGSDASVSSAAQAQLNHLAALQAASTAGAPPVQPGLSRAAEAHLDALQAKPFSINGLDLESLLLKEGEAIRSEHDALASLLKLEEALEKASPTKKLLKRRSDSPGSSDSYLDSESDDDDDDAGNGGEYQDEEDDFEALVGPNHPLAPQLPELSLDRLNGNKNPVAPPKRAADALGNNLPGASDYIKRHLGPAAQAMGLSVNDCLPTSSRPSTGASSNPAPPPSHLKNKSKDEILASAAARHAALSQGFISGQDLLNALEEDEADELSFEELARRIAEVNRKLGATPSNISYKSGANGSGGRGGFASRPSRLLICYADGLALEGVPFRKWTHPLAQASLHALMDGRFPFEADLATSVGSEGLDGPVYLEAVDRTVEPYSYGVNDPASIRKRIIQGDANVLASCAAVSNTINQVKNSAQSNHAGQGESSPKFRTLHDGKGSRQDNMPAARRLLESLPSVVIKNGVLHSVRDQIAARLGIDPASLKDVIGQSNNQGSGIPTSPGKPNPTDAAQPANPAIKDGVVHTAAALESGVDKSALCKVRVRLSDGTLATVSGTKTETLVDVVAALAKHQKDHVFKNPTANKSNSGATEAINKAINITATPAAASNDGGVMVGGSTPPTGSLGFDPLPYGLEPTWLFKVKKAWGADESIPLETTSMEAIVGESLVLEVMPRKDEPRGSMADALGLKKKTIAAPRPPLAGK